MELEEAHYASCRNGMVAPGGRRDGMSSGEDNTGMRTIDVHFTPDECDEDAVKDRTAVIIDVLRTSTTIAMALSNGCKEVIPARSVEAALELGATLDKSVTLLCGERDCQRMEGFHLGNSPLEYTRNRVGGRTLILSTTNGTSAITSVESVRDVLIGSFVNFRSILDVILRPTGDVSFVCAGRSGCFALEDAVCAGMFVASLTEALEGGVELNDGAAAAQVLYKKYARRIPAAVEGSEAGRNLARLGFVEDIEIAAKIDSIPVVPMFKEGRIVGV